MKRPMATIGFSMLLVSLLVINLSFKSSVALLIGATVVFCLFVAFRKLRKHKLIIFSAFAVAIYIISFIFTQNIYIKAEKKFENQVKISGVVCESPQETDYAFTYIIKPDNENYKIRYVSENNKMFREGDIVSGVVTNSNKQFKDVFFENSLSSEIYFTFFEGEKTFLDKTGDTNRFYANIGEIKNWFSDVIDTYIPGESGAIAKAMIIGDKSEIKDTTINHFNYAGTSHLLVISGLHLTLWSIGIMNFAERFSKLRKYTVVIGLLCLLGYSALTGFSVSVIRAGAMIGAILLGKALHRDADSINSIGVAITFILIINPYATLSTALWFTILSTLGILTLANNLIFKLKTSPKYKKVMQNSTLYFLITTIIISISTTIFTLPVFVIKIGLLPIASFISNIVMIDLALALMILAVVGVAFHLTGLTFIAEIFFVVVGAISNFLKTFAKQIGLAEWSTLSVSHKYYAYFIVFALASVLIASAFKKHKKILLKTVSVILSVVFVLIATYCTAYDYNTPSVNVICRDTTPILVVNSKGQSIIINPPTTEYEKDLIKILNSHNEKTIDNIIVTENTEYTPSYMMDLYETFSVENTYFCYDVPQIFENRAVGNVKSLSMGKNIKINAENYKTYVEIFINNKKLILIDGQNAENLIEKIKDYDIIILYGENGFSIKEYIENKNPDAKIYVSEDMKQYSFYFN
ncbi:MAG: ComEC/Rec2 family competence protein [Clostridia bacterium]|nr:ComEC/Rec2 family competence protein [Clostridia bacterium]